MSHSVAEISPDTMTKTHNDNIWTTETRQQYKPPVDDSLSYRHKINPQYNFDWGVLLPRAPSPQHQSEYTEKYIWYKRK
ncbi:unnamed protein product [Trichobilharzia regenti]|nr:unnamed protein product [Trichobilharzia regenti]